MKPQATERMRLAIDDAMDVHAGKAVIDGPQNYHGQSLSFHPGRDHRRRRAIFLPAI